MGLTEIIEDIEQESQQKKAKILEDARAEAEDILKKADAEKERLVCNYEDEAHKLALSERREKLSGARLDGRRMVVEVKEEVVKQMIDQLWDVLEELRSSPAYEQMLKDAIRQGAEELGSSCVVYAAQDDLESVQKLSAAHPQLVVSQEPIESAGGVVLVSSDGGIRFESTLESLIEESMETIRLEMYNHIFGEER